MPVLNIDKIKRGHQRFLAEFSREVDRALDPDALTSWAWRWVTQHGGFVSRSPNGLVAKTRVRITKVGKNRVVRSVNTAKYAAAQDRGSGLYGPKHRKYIIRAKRAGSLAFVVGGRLVFAKSVEHPGVHPTRFLYNENDALFRASKQWLRAAMDRAAQKF